MADVYLAGRRLSDLAEVGDLEWSSRWQRTGPSGPWEATWTFDLSPRVSVPWMGHGGMVEIYDGATRVWSGYCLEPTKSNDGWSMSAFGYARAAESIAALGTNGSGPSRKVDEVVSAAISRGWQVTVNTPGGLPSTAVAEETASGRLVTVADILNAYCEQNARRWIVTADRDVQLLVDPPLTNPTYAVSPDVLLPATNDEDWYSRVAVRYFDNSLNAIRYTTASNATAVARWGLRELLADRTGMGPIPSASAGAIATNLLNDVAQRMGWSEAITVTSVQLANPTGVPARLSLVRAGEVFEATSNSDGQGNLVARQIVPFIAGEVRYKDGSDEITVAPMGLKGRGVADIIEDISADQSDIESGFGTKNTEAA